MRPLSLHGAIRRCRRGRAIPTNIWCGNICGSFRKRRPLVPMRAAPADLARLPAAYIEPQEIDTLRDEAAAYAEALRDAGTTVEVNEVPGSYHGFDARHRKSLCTSSGRQTYLCHAGHAGQYQ